MNSSLFWKSVSSLRHKDRRFDLCFVLSFDGAQAFVVWEHTGHGWFSISTLACTSPGVEHDAERCLLQALRIQASPDSELLLFWRVFMLKASLRVRRYVWLYLCQKACASCRDLCADRRAVRMWSKHSGRRVRDQLGNRHRHRNPKIGGLHCV